MSKAALPIVSGERDEVFARIKSEPAYRVFAVPVSSSEDEETVRGYVSEALRLVPEIRREKLQKMQARWFKAYLEDISDNTALPESLQIEAKMIARAQARVIKSKQFLRASEISKLTPSSTKNPSGALNRWKQKHQVFALEMGGVDLYPIYALSREDGFRPYKEMKQILETLSEKTPWGLAFWFDSPNSYLRDRRPREVLGVDRNAVLEAARAEAAGILHG